MKKISSVVLSTLTAALLIGCGGGGSESSSSGSDSSSSSSSTDVTVERGPVLGAIVTDANNQIATQKAGTNVYTFATTPKYPISAIGGIIDVDGNGIDEGDVELTTVLESYSTIITPITTYIGNPTSQEGLSRISELKTIMGSDDSIRNDDLLRTVPSEVVNPKILFLTNAIYSNFIDTSISISSKYDSLDDFTELTKEELEEKVITDLGSYTINAIEAESKKTEIEKTSDTKLVFTNNTEYLSYTTGDDSYDVKHISSDKLKLESTNWFKNENVYNAYTDPSLDIKIDASNPSKFSYVDENAEEGTVTVQETKKITSFNGQPFESLSSDTQELSKSILKRVVTKAGTGIEDSNPNALPDGITTIAALLTYEEENKSNYFDTELDTIKPVSEGSLKYVTISENGKHKLYYEIKQNEQDSKYYLYSTSVAEVGYTEYETVYSGDYHLMMDLVSKIQAVAPIFMTPESESSIDIDENQTTVATIYATNPVQSIIKYSLSGTDAKLFNINESTGAITFKVAPDFEATPTKNQYKIKTNATNSFGKTAVHELTVNVTDLDDASTLSFVSGDLFKGLVYNVITSPTTGKEWLDRNLGASQACTSSTDTACYGDYYQWGRLADGHEKSNSTTTTTQASTISNVGNQFVTVIGDWTTEDSDGSLRSTLWSKTDGTGICPVGFRVPTSAEVTAEEITSSDTAFNNLKFPVAGARFLGTGSLDGESVWADVWTSSSSTTPGKSYYLNFEGNEVNVDFEYRADGRSVRCIKGN